MTDYIRSLIKRAKVPKYWHDTDAGKEALAALVALVQADEREWCAVVCDAIARQYAGANGFHAIERAANAIRDGFRCSHGHRDTSCDGQPQ